MSVFTDRFSLLTSHPSFCGANGFDAVFRGLAIRVLFTEHGDIIENGIETRGPTAEALDTDVPAKAKGDVITIDNIEYTITRIEGTKTRGVLRLILTKN